MKLLTFLLYVRQTWWLIWFWQFLSEWLSSLNLKRFYYSYAWSCSLCGRRTFFFKGLISRKLCGFLLMFLTGLTYSVLYFFFLCWSPSLSLCMAFDSILSDIDEVLLISPSANVFVFRDFNVHHKDWVTYSSGADIDLVNSYNFSISVNLTQIVNFPTQIPDCDVHSPALLDLCLYCDASICSTLAFPLLGNSDHAMVSVSIDFPVKSNMMPHFIVWLMATLMLIGLVFVIIWEMIHGKISLISVLLLLQVNFVSAFRLKLMYIPHRQYQVKPHLSPWFSTACAAAIVHRNHFFCLYQQSKSLKSKVKFRQTSNYCKGFLKLPNLLMLVKQKSLSFPRNLAYGAFGKLLHKSVLNRDICNTTSIQGPRGIVFCIW